MMNNIIRIFVKGSSFIICAAVFLTQPRASKSELRLTCRRKVNLVIDLLANLSVDLGGAFNSTTLVAFATSLLCQAMSLFGWLRTGGQQGAPDSLSNALVRAIRDPACPAGLNITTDVLSLQ